MPVDDTPLSWSTNLVNWGSIGEKRKTRPVVTGRKDLDRATITAALSS
jgi:hypothetical protein